MAKKFNFDKKMENDANNVIEEILQADFPLPEQAEAAKNEAQRIHIAKKIEKSKVWKLTNIVRMTESLLIIAIQRDLIENLKQYIRQYLA